LQDNQDNTKEGMPMKSLSKLMFCVGLALAIAPAAMATTTCPTGFYSAYNPAPPGAGPSITCTTNNLQFSNFNFENPTETGGATLPTPGNTAITPIDVLGNEGFSFNPGFTVGSGQSQDATVTFEVTALAGVITDLSLFFNGAFSGTGSTSFSETYCTTSFTTDCNTFQVNNPPPNLDKEITIPATTKLFITKDYAASGGTSGSASISKLTNQFSQVPEPASMALLGTALFGAYGLLRRRIRPS
jgi:hypothetical protein